MRAKIEAVDEKDSKTSVFMLVGHDPMFYYGMDRLKYKAGDFVEFETKTSENGNTYIRAMKKVSNGSIPVMPVGEGVRADTQVIVGEKSDKELLVMIACSANDSLGNISLMEGRDSVWGEEFLIKFTMMREAVGI